MTPEDLTYADRNRLRQMLDAEDLKQSGGMKSFDLNKPPTPPYQFREFPCMMFGASGITCAAHNSYERDQLRRQGWTDAPPWPGEYSDERPYAPAGNQITPAGNQQEQVLTQILQTLEAMQTRLEHQYNSIRELENRQAEFDMRVTQQPDEPEPPKPPAKKNPPPPPKKKPAGSAKGD